MSQTADESVLRSLDEIQRAHDALAGVILGEVPLPAGFNESQIRLAASVLCWALNHAHNSAFPDYLLKLENAIAEGGYLLAKRS